MKTFLKDYGLIIVSIIGIAFFFGIFGYALSSSQDNMIQSVLKGNLHYSADTVANMREGYGATGLDKNLDKAGVPFFTVDDGKIYYLDDETYTKGKGTLAKNTKFIDVVPSTPGAVGGKLEVANDYFVLTREELLTGIHTYNPANKANPGDTAPEDISLKDIITILVTDYTPQLVEPLETDTDTDSGKLSVTFTGRVNAQERVIATDKFGNQERNGNNYNVTTRTAYQRSDNTLYNTNDLKYADLDGDGISNWYINVGGDWVEITDEEVKNANDYEGYGTLFGYVKLPDGSYAWAMDANANGQIDVANLKSESEWLAENTATDTDRAKLDYTTIASTSYDYDILLDVSNGVRFSTNKVHKFKVVYRINGYDLSGSTTSNNSAYKAELTKLYVANTRKALNFSIEVYERYYEDGLLVDEKRYNEEPISTFSMLSDVDDYDGKTVDDYIDEYAEQKLEEIKEKQEELRKEIEEEKKKEAEEKKKEEEEKKKEETKKKDDDKSSDDVDDEDIDDDASDNNDISDTSSSTVTTETKSSDTVDDTDSSSSDE